MLRGRKLTRREWFHCVSVANVRGAQYSRRSEKTFPEYVLQLIIVKRVSESNFAIRLVICGGGILGWFCCGFAPPSSWSDGLLVAWEFRLLLIIGGVGRCELA